MLGIGLGLVQPAIATVAAASTSTWNPATSNAAYAFSGGNLIATRSSGSGDVDVFGTNGHTTGAQSCIITPNRSSGVYFVGLANASESNTNFIGGSANSIGIFNSDGNIYKGGGVVASPAATLGNTTPIKVILDGGFVYFQVDNGSGFADVAGMNYAARTGGIAAPSGALFPAADAGGVCAFTLDATNWP